ncbi:hypothetical protein RYR53_000532 [Aeromonas hydrophila]|nr:hypothetical protein [Aeromonas hydrophila]
MELGVYDLESAVAWYINYISNGDEYPDQSDIVRCIHGKTFPHLDYFYGKNDIDPIKINESPKITKRRNGSVIITNIPNDIQVDTKVTKKMPDEYSYLSTKLREKNITLENVLDIEFFERYEAHINYHLQLTGGIEEVYKEFSNSVEPSVNHKVMFRKTKSPQSLIKLLYEMQFNEFESIFMGGDSSHLYDVLDDSGEKIDKKKFTAFLDTEKIHMQFAMCSFGPFKNIPVLAYFGYGNYYPFSQKVKNKNDRLERFSQINKGDIIDTEYYMRELTRSNNDKTKDLQKKINECQKNYHEYFKEKFDLKDIKKKHLENNGCENNYPSFVDSFMMLEPVIRTKSAALIAYEYPFYP